MSSPIRNTAFLTLVCGAALCAQTASLSVASEFGSPGAVVSVPMVLGGGVNLAGVQWNLTYPTADVVAQSATLGPAAAGKSIDCVESTGATTWTTCVIYGIGQNSVQNGIVAYVNFQIQPGTTVPSVAIQPSSLSAVTPGGLGLPIFGAGGTLTVEQSCGEFPPTLLLENQTLSGTQTLGATSTATLGQNLIVNGANIVITAPVLTILANTEISGTFTAGSNPSCS